MKFMKLGSKPDAFQAEGRSTRYVSSDLATDVTIHVGEVKFYLHKFPLLSKSSRLQKLVIKSTEENSNDIHMADFPGGPKAFEICAKFCYGMTVTLNAYNVVAARCAAEYLEMNEDIEKGNLVFKIEVFLNSSILRSWKDSIIVLQTTKSLLPWAEDLKIVGRCIDSIASRTSVDPANVTWSYTFNRKLSEPDRIVEDSVKFREKTDSVPKDWWVEDICELDIDLYKRVMIAVKSKGRMDGTVIGEALKTYAVRWLPDSIDALVSEAHSRRNKSLVETIICLLPADKGVGCSCSFLFKLLKVAILVGADEPLREDLVGMIGLKLHEARVNDLLIPARSHQATRYDVELVQSIVNRYTSHHKCDREWDAAEKNGKKGYDDFILGDGSLMSVGRLVDEYLAEIARDPNLTLPSFTELAKSFPESSRPIHDGLYKAIDIYLKDHPSLSKAEKKNICALLDVKKLTPDASTHAAQNERLPLRVVVQVLYFEQVRSAAAAQPVANHRPNLPRSLTAGANIAGDRRKLPSVTDRSLGTQIRRVKLAEELPVKVKPAKKGGGGLLMQSRSRRIFDRLWAVGKGHGENRSSETSASSQSPNSVAPWDAKSCGGSSRQRRHSIS